VALLQQRLQEQKVNAKVVNASISGDTTAGGRARLPALLTQHQPTVVVIELGGNDALRGLPLKNTEDNLAMVQAAQKAGAQVLLVGMQVPPNYGGDYTRRFAQTFVTVSQQYKTALVPFCWRGGRCAGCHALVPGRPHSPQRAGPSAHAGQRVARAQGFAALGACRPALRAGS
jgi:acyl-CoA thioesterase-1